MITSNVDLLTMLGQCFIFSNVCLITSFTVLLGKPSLGGITKNITPQKIRIFFSKILGQDLRNNNETFVSFFIGGTSGLDMAN
jgi:hypothetical protein